MNGNCTIQTSTIPTITTAIEPTTTTTSSTALPTTTTIQINCSPVVKVISEIIDNIVLSFDTELQFKKTAEEKLFRTDLSVQNMITSLASRQDSTCINLKDQLKSPIAAHEKFLQCVAEVNTQKFSKVEVISGILSSNNALIASCQLPVSYSATNFHKIFIKIIILFDYRI